MIKIGIFLDKFLNKPTSLQSFYFKDGDRYCLHTHNKLPKKLGEPKKPEGSGRSIIYKSLKKLLKKYKL